ncbi:MAG: hypothetical protein KatS3mg081_0271 [Gemmatimonadales bacterium]|nr:hypothetical protein HRbin33_02175 [bacterium HR33]GIW50916.1 MAG: hypothetical protein KatS3mg081_0271 [Gemmatimonadales bacterium]
MEERDLERMARRLGHERAEALDPERVARGVLDRLRTEAAPGRARRVVWSAPQLLRLAAVLVLFLAGGLLFLSLPPADKPETRMVAVPELYELSEDQLVEVLDSLALEAPVFEHVVVLSDLGEAELRELLRAMEG